MTCIFPLSGIVIPMINMATLRIAWARSYRHLYLRAFANEVDPMVTAKAGCVETKLLKPAVIFIEASGCLQLDKYLSSRNVNAMSFCRSGHGCHDPS